MMKFFIALIFCFCLAACATKPVYKPVTVEVPIVEPCRPPVVLHPVWPTASLPPQATFVDRIKALLAENELRRGYEAQLEAAVKYCQP